MPRNIISTKRARVEKMSVRELLKARGVVDRKGLVSGAAEEMGFDLDQTIEDFMEQSGRSDPKLAELYKNPILTDLESAFEIGRIGQAATIAVMAVAVAVVAVAAAAITQRAREFILTEIDVAEEINLITE